MKESSSSRTLFSVSRPVYCPRKLCLLRYRISQGKGPGNEIGPCYMRSKRTHEGVCPRFTRNVASSLCRHG